jgi:hypothetical protein
MPRSTKYTLGAATSPGFVVYNSTGTTAAVCDADSSQAATSALRPLGVLRAGGGTGDEAVISKQGEEVPFIAGGVISDGDRLICLDGGGGVVVALTTATLASLFADGDPIYSVGVASEPAASGTTFVGVHDIQLITASEPA